MQTEQQTKNRYVGDRYVAEDVAEGPATAPGLADEAREMTKTATPTGGDDSASVDPASRACDLASEVARWTARERQLFFRQLDREREVVGLRERCKHLENHAARMNAGGVLLPSEAIFAFAGWLTSRRQAVTFGATHDAAIVAELVAEFCKSQELVDPRSDWSDRLLPYPRRGSGFIQQGAREQV